jgi:hypothetical protein
VFVDAPLSVVVETVATVLGPDRRLGLPHRQRPYAWKIEQVQRLLSDLMAACSAPPEKQQMVLGRVLLVHDRSADADMIVDGHQRLVTMTILIGVLRDLAVEPDERRALAALVGGVETAAGRDGPQARYRVMPQTNLARVLSHYVQAEGATGIEADVDLATLSEGEANVILNRDFVRARLLRGDVTADMRYQLVKLIVGGCWLVVQKMDDEDLAWKLLNDEENTGLEFTKTDRAKTTILSDLPLEDRQICTKMWEDWEHAFGAKDTLALLQHTRTLLLRRRSEKPIEIDICKELMADGGGVAFFRNELQPRADLLRALRAREVGRGAVREGVARSLAFLSWIEPQVWVPAAMRWQEARGDGDAQTELFYQRLERLVWLMRISGAQPVARERRILEVIEDIDREPDVSKFTSLKIEWALRASAIKDMRGNNFFGRGYCNAVLRRLTVLAGDSLATAERDDLTVEHVLPRRPENRTRWLKDFTNRARVRSYADRLGNLTLLTSEENGEVGAKEFADKTAVFLRSEVALGRDVGRAASWMPDVVDRRTMALIGQLMAAWELEAP